MNVPSDMPWTPAPNPTYWGATLYIHSLEMVYSVHKVAGGVNPGQCPCFLLIDLAARLALGQKRFLS